MKIVVDSEGMTDFQQDLAFVLAKKHAKNWRRVKTHTYETISGNFKITAGKTIQVRLV